MSTFMQTGDIHIGECRTIPNYLSRHQEVLWQIKDRAVRTGQTLVIAGDLFHTKTPTFEERCLADSWLGALEANGVVTLLSPGNHDHLYGNTFLLDGFRHWPKRWVRITGYEPELIAIGDTAFLCIAWGGHSKETLNLIVRQHLPTMLKHRYRVVVCHECIVGSRFDNGKLSPKGTALPDIPEITYWAVGDIHTCQTTNLSNGWYAGAPLQFRFDDQETKGWLEVDLDQPTAPTFYATNFKKLRVVDSVNDITDDAFYMVSGSVEEVLKGNKLDSVIRTNYAVREKAAISYQKLSITDGLPEYLALYGFDDQYQRFAVDWVNQTLNTRA